MLNMTNPFLSFTMISGETVTERWRRLLSSILRYGINANPRGMETVELLGMTTRIPMADSVILSSKRELGYKFMNAEAAWILSGDNRVSTIAPYAKMVKDFSDDGIRYFGAYGPPLRDQLSHVTRSLRNDRDTRQAVITLWRPNPPPSKDIPCTIALQWVIRDDLLHCLATMRSSDAWLGVPYDWRNFSLISHYLLLELPDPKPHLGDLFFTAASQHLYKRNSAGVLACIDDHDDLPAPTPTIYERILKGNITTGDQLVDFLWSEARNG